MGQILVTVLLFLEEDIMNNDIRIIQRRKQHDGMEQTNTKN